MKGLLVYDSFFGNTQKIAEAVGKVLVSKGDVQTIKASEVNPQQLQGLDLLIVGSPTRAFRPTPAVTKLLRSIPSGALKGTRVAAFDTRIPVDEIPVAILKFFAGIFGYAAKPMANLLVKKGGNLAVPAEGFFVKDSEGPLKDGELERAAAWAKHILTGS